MHRRSLQEEFAMNKLLRIVSVSILAVLMLLLSPDLLAKTAAITLAKLVQRSPVIVLGQIDNEAHSTRANSRWVSFKPSKVIKGDASLADHDIQLCNSPPPMREYPELSKLTGDAVLFLSTERGGCFEFSHTTTSVVQVRAGRATTAAIADQPIYQPWEVFLRKLRSLISKQGRRVS